jgi:hypothetical protein
LHYTFHQIHPTTTTNPTNPTNPNSNKNKTFTPIFSSPLHHHQQQQQLTSHFLKMQKIKLLPRSSPKSYALGKAKGRRKISCGFFIFGFFEILAHKLKQTHVCCSLFMGMGKSIGRSYF